MVNRAFLALVLLISVALPAIAQQQQRVIPRGSVTVTAGQTTADIPVVIQGDTVVEPDEGYTVTISSPTLQLGTATATGTIINDDGKISDSELQTIEKDLQECIEALVVLRNKVRAKHAGDNAKN